MPISRISRFACIIALSLAGAALPAWADTETLTLLKSGSAWGGAVDDSTGEMVTGNYSSTFNIWSSPSAFVAQTGGSTATISGNSQNPDFVVQNGNLYSRMPDNYGQGGVIGEWSLATGQLVASYNTGLNPDSTWGFDYGGDSAVPVMADQTGIYAIGQPNFSSSTWTAVKLSANLTPISSVSFNAGSAHPGYAFAIGGELFIGSSYDSGSITEMVNLSTGAVTNISDYLAMPGTTGRYIVGTSYDPGSDKLYVFEEPTYANTGTNNDVWVLNSASAAFDVSLPAVPEPASMTMLAAGGLLALRRRQA